MSLTKEQEIVSRILQLVGPYQKAVDSINLYRYYNGNPDNPEQRYAGVHEEAIAKLIADGEL